MTADIFKLNNDRRFNEVYSQCQKVDRCGKNTDDGCGCLQPDSYKVDGINGIMITIGLSYWMSRIALIKTIQIHYLSRDQTIKGISLILVTCFKVSYDFYPRQPCLDHGSKSDRSD